MILRADVAVEAGIQLTPFVAGVIIGLVFLVPVYVSARRRGVAFLAVLEARRGVQAMVVGSAAFGTFHTGNGAELETGINFPFDSPRTLLGLVITSDTIELWDRSGRQGAPAIVFRRGEPPVLTARVDEHTGPLTIWLRWATSDGEWNLGFVPRRVTWLGRRPLRKEARTQFIDTLTHHLADTLDIPGADGGRGET